MSFEHNSNFTSGGLYGIMRRGYVQYMIGKCTNGMTRWYWSLYVENGRDLNWSLHAPGFVANASFRFNTKGR